MSEVKFTQGEWRRSRKDVRSYNPVSGELEVFVYRPNSAERIVIRGPNADADGDLIAASPDLYAACEKALPLVKALAKHQEYNGKLLFDDEPIMHIDDIRQIEKALAKARGKA